MVDIYSDYYAQMSTSHPAEASDTNTSSNDDHSSGTPNRRSKVWEHFFGGGSNGNAHTVGVWKKYGARVVASAASYLRLIMAFGFRLAFLIFENKKSRLVYVFVASFGEMGLGNSHA